MYRCHSKLYETNRSPALELNVVKGSSSTSVPLDSCEFAFCERKFGNKFPESVLRKLPDCDWDIICQLPTDDVVDSCLWRENAVMGTVTGLVRLKWEIRFFFCFSQFDFGAAIKHTVLEVANNCCFDLVYPAILLCYYCYLDCLIY